MSTYTETTPSVSYGPFMGVQVSSYFTTGSQALNRSEPSPGGAIICNPWHRHGAIKIIPAFNAVAGRGE